MPRRRPVWQTAADGHPPPPRGFIGRRRYPQAACLLILADSGGSNGARCRGRKYALQTRLADPYQLSVTVCHYPTVVRLIGETRTKTGLKVSCRLVTTPYATGRKVTHQEMADLNLQRHRVLPQWNYTLLPREHLN